MFFMSEEGIKKHYERKAQKQICKDNAKTEYKQKVLENRKKLIPNMLEIKQLKAQLKEPAIRRRISNILLLLAIIMTCVTTLTTIAGGLHYRDTFLTMLTYILFVVFAQLTILVISCLKPYLYNKAPRYIGVTSLLQVFLLIVSISFNFIFLHNSDNSFYIVFLNLILCIIFDLVILVICELSFVIRLNIQFAKVKANNRLKNIASILIDNAYNSVIDRLTKKPVILMNSEVKQLEKPVIDKVSDTVINDIKDIILKHKVNNIAPSTKKILSLTDFKHNEVIQAKKKLIEDGFLKTVGNTTYINNLEVVG
jgi:FlaA1/EpsC-like NDP-sugar epimerase